MPSSLSSLPTGRRDYALTRPHQFCRVKRRIVIIDGFETQSHPIGRLVGLVINDNVSQVLARALDDSVVLIVLETGDIEGRLRVR